MTNEEKFSFDLEGYLVIRNVLTAGDGGLDRRTTLRQTSARVSGTFANNGRFQNARA